MQKTIRKVKLKRVRYKKTKKVAKKKVAKKKVAKKKVAKKKVAKKKVAKRKRKKKITMDDVYKILNKVQINKKKIVFAMFIDDSFSAENIIKDLNIQYDKKEMKTQTVFTLYPSDNNELDILDVDYLDDEILEDGQIFG